MYHDIQRLKQAGYTVEERSPWHYQLAGPIVLNIWPSKRKWMVQYGSGASFYNNFEHLLEIVRNLIGEPGARRGRNPRWLVDRIHAEHESQRTDADRDAERIWREGLVKLQKQLSPALPLAKAVDGSIMPR